MNTDSGQGEVDCSRNDIAGISDFLEQNWDKIQEWKKQQD